jgi:hypothetical protein
MREEKKNSNAVALGKLVAQKEVRFAPSAYRRTEKRDCTKSSSGEMGQSQSRAEERARMKNNDDSRSSRVAPTAWLGVPDGSVGGGLFGIPRLATAQSSDQPVQHG